MIENINHKVDKINIDELSQRLGIKKMTIYSWVNKQVIPYYKIGKLVRFDGDEIDKWLLGKRVNVYQYKSIREKSVEK